MTRPPPEHSSDWQQAQRLLRSGDAAASRAHGLRLLRAEPHFAPAAHLVAVSHAVQQDFAAADAWFLRALELDPHAARVHMDQGRSRAERGDSPGAIESFRRALQLQRDLEPARHQLVDALFTLAETRRAGGEPRAAIDLYREVVQLEPQLVEAHNNLGLAWLEAGEPAAAAECLAQAVALRPSAGAIRKNLGFARLQLRDFALGWELFECRLDEVRLALPPGCERWDGLAPPSGELILVAEQGLGDTIQFARCAKIFADRGNPAVLHCDPRLAGLMSTTRLFARVEGWGSPAGRADSRWYPLLSLPRLLRTEPFEDPPMEVYLRPDLARVRYWRQQLEGVRGLRIGIAWQGNPQAERGSLAGRSIGLEPLAPLAALAGVQLVSLQTGPGAEALRHLDFARSVISFGDELDAGPQAFLDTAALMTQLDLVISSDTAVAHLAGALGVPVWIGLHATAEWRWFTDTDRSPWYPTMRLFRQTVRGDWSTVVESMVARLRSAGPR
jgi:tetratricopeptide (TPR) repeat protein